MEKLEAIRDNNHLRNLLLAECDIYFYDEIREVQFSYNNEEYSLACHAFAQDGSGGEYVILEDESIGFIGSEGQVGRVAESLDDLLTFLLMLVLSQTFLSFALSNKDLLVNSVKDFSIKYEKTTSQKAKSGIK